MALKGWISVHRKMTEWEWYGDSNVFRLFIHLLLLANHKDNSWRGITVPAGSLITGRKSLSADLNLSEQQIRTAIKKLKSTSEITTQITNEYSMISITNWDNYQGRNQPDNQRVTSEQPTDNQRITTNNNENNDNNVNKQTPLAMLTAMNVDEKIASEWLKVRKEKRLAATQTAFDAANKQAGIAGMDFNAALKLCVEESWGGFKADWLKNKAGNNNGTRGNETISKQPDNSATRHHNRLKALYADAVAEEMGAEAVQQVPGYIRP